VESGAGFQPALNLSKHGRLKACPTSSKISANRPVLTIL